MGCESSELGEGGESSQLGEGGELSQLGEGGEFGGGELSELGERCKLSIAVHNFCQSVLKVDYTVSSLGSYNVRGR